MEGTDEDYLLELDGLDITGVREQISRVQAERERQAESIERSQEKLKAMNYELAARKEEADRYRRRAREEADRRMRGAGESDGASEATGGGGAGGGGGGSILSLFGLGGSGAKTQAQDSMQSKSEEDVRQAMEQELRRHVEEGQRGGPRPVNQFGIRTFDERDLMVEQADFQDNIKARDTVLITHWRQGSAEMKWHLSYRIGKRTTGKQLRQDACFYWGLSEVEYCLWTLANAKVADDLPIQTCFNLDERAFLILCPKDPTKTEPPDRVIDLIRAKTGTNARVNKKKAAEVQQAADSAQTESLAEQMAKVPGVYEFMTQRDLKVVKHLARIRPTSICIYMCLFIATLYSFSFIRPHGAPFFCRLGIYEAVAYEPSQPFKAIRSVDGAWTWLSEVVPEQVFVESSSLRKANYLPGWLRVRMQQVAEASNTTCPSGSGVPLADPCLASEYSKETAGTGDLEDVRLYWETVRGVDGRANDTMPWRYMDDATGQLSGTTDRHGVFSAFDASGYVADYNLQHGNLSDVYRAFVQDMAALRESGWISLRTRAVHVTFAAYNGNWDYWASSGYLLEMPASGVVVPSSEVDVFRPEIDELSNDKHTTFLACDTFRLILVLGVLLFQMPVEVHYEIKTAGKVTNYLLGCMGLVDLTIVIIYLSVYIIRWLYDVIGFAAVVRLDWLSKSFRDEMEPLRAVKENIALEAFFFMFVCFRLLSFLRINRYVFLIWETINRSMKRCVRFMAIFAPVTASFVYTAFMLWRAEKLEYRTFWASLTSILMVLLGDNQALGTGAVTKPWTVAFMLCAYIFLTLFFMNEWVAVFVMEFQKVRVSSGFRPSDYRWTEFDYAQWLLPGPAARLYVNKLRPHIRPVTPEDDD